MEQTQGVNPIVIHSAIYNQSGTVTVTWTGGQDVVVAEYYLVQITKRSLILEVQTFWIPDLKAISAIVPYEFEPDALYEAMVSLSPVNPYTQPYTSASVPIQNPLLSVG